MRLVELSNGVETIRVNANNVLAIKPGPLRAAWKLVMVGGHEITVYGEWNEIEHRLKEEANAK